MPPPCWHCCPVSLLCSPCCCPLPVQPRDHLWLCFAEVSAARDGGNTLNPSRSGGGEGQWLALQEGLAALQLPLHCAFLTKPFSKYLDSTPQHSAGNYKCLWLASIGNVPTAKPFPHLQLTGYGGTASSVRGMQSEAQHACSRSERVAKPPCSLLGSPAMGFGELHCTHNSLMRMSGTQMLSAGSDICVMLSKHAGSHRRNSSVQCCRDKAEGNLAVGSVLAPPKSKASSPPWECAKRSVREAGKPISSAISHPAVRSRKHESCAFRLLIPALQRSRYHRR